ncbi:MAG: tRNA pseudouridine(38-40) synthase TruA [Armatimonadota bacterium]|nr:tRNA pseudouridine(38-40) synthase TruA [Armatimonadota bacterium]MDR7452656.1 tRNA pseudouridine(38-40) synthase TruA [Armatimonadota bacterium]MDR7468159.1 tRNA pseudouridine(38-40) synthase TruA [Armatimonadota bacterium]MDR7495153.1 tRNA pseudouridine(38-40) synthase TruA [Armatimonadota bacterium]MDR7499287.1 tRNA pseudouridine(38-40) synthase TruA [Armatimonadota bacterium]
MTRNIRLTIEYDGTDFSGWQRLRRRPSVQEEIERAIRAVTRESVHLIGAGRTDAGVHALGQVANFRTASRLPVERIPPALNHHLPPTIRILEAAEVDLAFHARYSALGRTYRYAVLNRPAPSAILRNHAHHVPQPLALDALAEALPALQGRHAFTSFRATGSRERSTVCTLRRAEVVRSGDIVIFTFEADRFLRHMVRLMVGTLLRVGTGKLPPQAVAEILAAEDNARAGPRAPARGLFLVRVDY